MSKEGAPPAPVYPSECPMHESNQTEAAKPPAAAPYPSECPMSSEAQAKTAQQGDINPTNMMPPPNQRPSPDQPFPLSTNRVSSSIPKFAPKGEEDKTWQYPSPQMFWNAMSRKGWRWQEDDPCPETMNNIISIHNVNNERAWREVLLWETAYHADECPWQKIKLKRFSGKAKDFSWKAKVRGWMGYELPFDRHDWIIDRCGKERTYVIDYYDGPMDHDTYQFSVMDVRPHPLNMAEVGGMKIWPEGMFDRSTAMIQRHWFDAKQWMGITEDVLTPKHLDKVKAVPKETPTKVDVDPSVNPVPAPGHAAVNIHEPLDNSAEKTP